MSFLLKHVPITRGMRHAVASRHLRSIKTCPHSVSNDESFSEFCSFILFSHLPAEVRTQIWMFAFLEPHMVELELLPSTDIVSDPQQLLPPWRIRNKNPHPLLSTCIESREEVLKIYHSSRRSKQNPIPINFAIDSLFLRNLNFDSDLGYRPPNADCVKCDGYSVAPLRIFETVESLTISRESILDAECEAESIIRHCFPNLCLLIVTVDCHSKEKISSNQPFDLLLHPEDNCHNSVFGPASSICHWDAIYASRVKVNMQRRFARQERIHRGYIAPIVKLVSVFSASRPWSDISAACLAATNVDSITSRTII